MTGRIDNGTRGTPRLRRDDGSGGKWDNLPPATTPPTDEEFDALTDLFLGEIGNVSGQARATIAVSSPPALPAAPGRGQPVLRLAGLADDIDAIDGEDAPAVGGGTAQTLTPAKTRLVPVESREGESRSRQDQPDRSRDSAAVPETSAIVECIVLGHLAVSGAAWAAHYVREVAQASGRPVAYLRLQHGYASIELIGGDGSSAELPSAKSVDEGVKLASQRTRRWVVRADVGEEAKLATSPLIRVITLLTGVDEAAVVAAYGSVKSLAASLSAPTIDAPGPVMRVAAMGAQPDKAQPAAKRLADAITRFVGRPVDTAICSAKIASSRPSEVLFTGRTEIDPAAAMELLARVSSQTEIIEAPPRVLEAESFGPRLVQADATSSGRSVAALDLHAVEPEIDAVPEEEEIELVDAAASSVATFPKKAPVIAATAAATANVSPPPAPPRRVSAAERNTVVPESKPFSTPEPMREPERELAPEISAVGIASGGERAEVLADAPSALALLLPGLRPISVRCPYAEHVEFAVDRSGTLHLLSRPETGAEERSLSELLVAGAWADAHACMLAAAIGQSASLVASGMSDRAELHLFTDRPKGSRRLLETSVNLHLLARVEVRGQAGWYCTDLN